MASPASTCFYCHFTKYPQFVAKFGNGLRTTSRWQRQTTAHHPPAPVLSACPGHCHCASPLAESPRQSPPMARRRLALAAPCPPCRQTLRRGRGVWGRQTFFSPKHIASAPAALWAPWAPSHVRPPGVVAHSRRAARDLATVNGGPQFFRARGTRAFTALTHGDDC